MRFQSRPPKLTSPFILSLIALFGARPPTFMLPAMPHAQEGTHDKSEPKGITVQEIIKRFSIKEKAFKEARDHYTDRQDVKVMTLDGDTPDGKYEQVFDVSFDDKGRRVKNIVFAPQDTL